MQTSFRVDKENLIFAFAEGCLHAVSSVDGEIIWRKDFAAERFDLLVFPVFAFH